MSSEIQLLIETLTATREDVAGVREQIEKKTVAGPTLKALQTEVVQLKGSLVGLTAASIRNAAETGAKATVADLNNAASALRMAAEGGLDTRKALGRGKVATIALAALLSLLAAFTGGVSMAGILSRTYPALVTLVVPPKVLTPRDCTEQNGLIGEQNGKSYCSIWFK